MSPFAVEITRLAAAVATAAERAAAHPGANTLRREILAVIEAGTGPTVNEIAVEIAERPARVRETVRLMHEEQLIAPKCANSQARRWYLSGRAPS